MDKEIGELTFKEASKICYDNTDYFGWCNKKCPLLNICGVTKHVRCLTFNKEILSEKVEVEE